MSENVLAYFLRHGTTSLNDTNSFRGDSNPPLDEKGYRDAVAAKNFFGTQEFGEVIGSDKLRVQQTADTVLLDRNEVLNPTPSLRAWNVGYLTGLKKDEHKDEIDYYQQNPDVQVPKGESLNDFKKRIRPGIEFAIRRGHETGIPSLVVAHSSIIHEVGHLIHNDHEKCLVHPGGIVAVKMGPKGIKAEPVFKAEHNPVGYGS
jgi:broad specificity phosphatase PhoE